MAQPRLFRPALKLFAWVAAPTVIVFASLALAGEVAPRWAALGAILSIVLALVLVSQGVVSGL